VAPTQHKMILHYTPAQVLRIGLKLIGVSRERQQRQLHKTNVTDFKAHFGTEPIVCAKMWDDLQTTDIADAKIKATLHDGANLKNFLRACHFLMRYKTEAERKVDSGHTKKTVRKWTWFFLAKIKALKAAKVGHILSINSGCARALLTALTPLYFLLRFLFLDHLAIHLVVKFYY